METGRISVEEFGACIRTFGYNPTQTEIKSALQEYDLNKNGFLEFNEFCNMASVMEQKVPYSETEIEEAFAKFDTGLSSPKKSLSFQALALTSFLLFPFKTDGDGFISWDELVAALMNQGEAFTQKEAEDLMKFADLDGDGKINISEFSRTMFAGAAASQP